MTYSPAFLTPNYKRASVAFTHGKGVWLFDSNGEKYLDFSAGIAVSSLGHAHPVLTAALQRQVGRLLHVSNLYHIPECQDAAEILVKHSFADYVLFANSGTEANEGLVKIMRRAQFAAGHPERTAIITFTHSFHGRTLAMLAATGNPKYQEGFGKMPEDFRQAVFNDLESVKKLLDGKVAGILVEPVQGESGLSPINPEFLRGLREICNQHDLYLGLDEVQTGIGRTGHLFAYQHFNIEPDLLSLAKGLGGGVPIGAVLVRKQPGDCLTPGTHGSTFAGNPLATMAAKTVLGEILSKDFLAKVRKTGQIFEEKLRELTVKFPDIFKAQRGIGLMQGLQCVPPVATVAQTCLNEHLLTVPAGDNVLRLLPPLIVSEQECHEAVEKLSKVAQILKHKPEI